jgi:hypothetical protein
MAHGQGRQKRAYAIGDVAEAELQLTQVVRLIVEIGYSADRDHLRTQRCEVSVAISY